MPHVLVVDDNPDGRDALSLLLEHWGYRVDAVGSGTEALQLAAMLRPDIIVLDMGLPDMDGCEVVRQLRRRGCDRFVIGYSAFWTYEESARRAGCDAYVLKPAIDPLLAVLDDVRGTAAR
jgi:two-component system CheB/CheR fusion protein